MGMEMEKERECAKVIIVIGGIIFMRTYAGNQMTLSLMLNPTEQVMCIIIVNSINSKIEMEISFLPRSITFSSATSTMKPNSKNSSNNNKIYNIRLLMLNE